MNRPLLVIHGTGLTRPARPRLAARERTLAEQIVRSYMAVLQITLATVVFDRLFSTVDVS